MTRSNRRAAKRGTRRSGRCRPGTFRIVFPLLATLGWGAVTATAQSPPSAESFRELVLSHPPVRVVDGDTFEADLDGDGKLEFPRERVRLLYVDTPELSESRKGRDLRHGIPAREFLAAALTQAPLRLLIPRREPTGNYGRTLAVVEAGGRRVNLELIRRGHSPFDTRFRFPGDYPRYAAAEGEAFDARRGIWSDRASRMKYLKRLRREGKTPAGSSNALYVGKVQIAATFRPRSLLGKYVRLKGSLAERRVLSKGVVLLLLERGAGRTAFPAVVFRRRAERLRVLLWPERGRLRVEGFLQSYRGRMELVVHYGRPPGGAR